MKNKLFILLYIINSLMYGQNTKIISVNYKVNFSQNVVKSFRKKKNDVKNKKTYNFWEKIYENSVPIDAVLNIVNNEAIFKVKNSIDKKDDIQINLLKSFSGAKKSYYSNNLNENLIQNCHSLGECFLIERKINKWEISQKTKIVQGYKCYKATTYIIVKNKKQRVTAWFTPKLSFGFGPMGFSGLPGLILELDDNVVKFVASKIEINPKKKIKVKKPLNGIKISEKEFLKLLNKSVPVGW